MPSTVRIESRHVLVAAFTSCVFWVTPACAHGFGQRFDLPLPLYLWVWGAGGTIVFTFVVMALFVNERVARFAYPQINLLGLPALAFSGNPLVLRMLRGVIAGVFLICVFAGLYGTQDPYRNLLPTMVWIIWWVGFAFFSALIGNLWAVVHPLRTIFTWGSLVTASRYPARLGTWPAVAMFLIFAWMELIWKDKDVPRRLAEVVVAYGAVMGAGMLIWGRDHWLRHGDPFSVAFGVLGRFAPVAIGKRRASADHAVRELYLRPPAIGLLADGAVSWSFLVFVLTMLATVTFDGFLETPPFQSILSGIYRWPALARLSYEISEFGIDDATMVKTATLIAFPALFVAAFCFCGWLTSLIMGKLGSARNAERPTTSYLARSFVLTLVPIAVAYHLAHYLSLLLTAGQLVIPLISDPFGLGWDLFGTAHYRVNLGIVGPKFFWYTSVSAIVIGHILAVYLAHVVALRLFGDRRSALVSQIPMIALMVGYTMISLWILAQPVVG